MWYVHDGGWGWLWMAGGMLAFWALVGTVIVVLVRALAADHRDAGPSRALAILDERYARGEINDEEYRHRRAQLTGGAGPGPA